MSVRAYGKSVAAYTPWAAETEYSLQDFCVPTEDNGLCYECTQAGESGLTEPVWNNLVDSTVKDGTVVWTCREKLEQANPLSVTLSVEASGGFSHKEIWVKSDSEENVDFIIYGSYNGADWRQIEELSVPYASRDNRYKGLQNAYPFIKVSTDAAAVNEIEIVAGE